MVDHRKEKQRATFVYDWNPAKATDHESGESPSESKCASCGGVATCISHSWGTMYECNDGECGWWSAEYSDHDEYESEEFYG